MSNTAASVVSFLGMIVELNEVETSMLATLSPYTTATGRETSIVIGTLALLALIPMFSAFAAPAVAAFVLQTIMLFLSVAPIVYLVGRHRNEYAIGEALTPQAQGTLVGICAAVALFVAIGVHRTYMKKRIEQGKCCACVVYPGYGTLTLLSAGVIAFVGLAVDSQSKENYLRVIKAGSVSIAMIVSLVVGNLLEHLLPYVAVLWGVGIACPMILGTAIIAFMNRSECPDVVATASNILNYEMPPPFALPLDEGQLRCARVGAYVAGGCAAAGAVAILVQLLMYCCFVRPRAAKARAEEELAATLGPNNTTFNLTVNEVAVEAVPLLGAGAPMGYSGYPAADIAVGTPIVVSCQ